MNKEKIEEVSKMVDVDTSDVIDSKIMRILKGSIFPFIQVGFFLISSLLGLVFGHWENKSPSTYPYGPFGGPLRAYIWGPVTLIGVGSGNLALSLKTRKRFGIDKIISILTVVLNLALSLTSFFLLYKLIESDSYSPYMTVVPEYNVYKI